MPESLGNLPALTHLDLNNNQLTPLPASLSNLAALEGLVLRGNQSIRLPEWLGEREQLVVHADETRR